VKLGFVASLSHPGGNVTGFANLNPEMVPKRLDLLHAVLPAATTIALLDNPTNPGMATQTVPMAAQTVQMQAVARGMGITLPVLRAGSESELEAAFGALRGLSAGRLVIGADGFFYTRPARLAALAVRHRMPAIFMFREFAAAGGLMSYGPVWPIRLALPEFMPAAFLRAKSRPICRCSWRPNPSLSSTSRPPRRSVSPSHPLCSPLPTR
jgi:putative tryptophan/tyrosine transport system substrate-binding protein